MTEILEKYITYRREPFFEIAKKEIVDGYKVLDVGSGNGAFTEYCRYPDMFLFEDNKDSYDLLAKKYKNVYFGKLPNLPFEDNFFDLIHCSHVIEHLEPEQLYNTLIEFDRILKKGGFLIISTPLLWSGFYDDLSHVKPYSPTILEKYLCGLSRGDTTRPRISEAYKVVSLNYRYLENYKRFNFHTRRFKFIGQSIVFVLFLFKKLGFLILEKTGYTIVLQKY